MKKQDEEKLIRVKKEAITKICIAYPNKYSLAMSNLGFLSIICLINSHPLALGERASLLLERGSTQNKKKAAKLCSLDSGRPLNDFDIVAFSISFENDYINVVRMLKQAAIPVYANKRDESSPLIIAGGIATMLNPEPIADFIDVFLLGDSPEMVNEFVDVYTASARTLPKKELLKKLAKIKGVYVPSFYSVKYNDNGTINSFSHEPGIKPEVNIAMAKDLTVAPAYSYIISKDALFSDMLLI